MGSRTFGKRLREQRLRKGLTQGDLAEKAGVHLVTICRWEKDVQVMSNVAAAAKAAKALGVSKAWLVYGEGEPPEGEVA
jgi:transcriptional regulator with XRE-family HTH domain